MIRSTVDYTRGSRFCAWSPLDLAHVLGYYIDLRTSSGALRQAFIIGPRGRSRPTDHAHAWRALSRLAQRRGVDPQARPAQPRRALIDGRLQGVSPR